MKTFLTHPVMLQDADLDYVTGGGLNTSGMIGGTVNQNQFTGDNTATDSFSNTTGCPCPDDDDDGTCPEA